MIRAGSIGNEMFLPSRVGHHCGVQQEHDDNIRVADRWVFLAELFVQCGLQANNEEEIAWCSGGTATPRRLALWARRPRFSTSIDWDTPGSLLSNPVSSSPSRWTTNWKKFLVEYATVAYLVVHSPSRLVRARHCSPRPGSG